MPPLSTARRPSTRLARQSSVTTTTTSSISRLLIVSVIVLQLLAPTRLAIAESDNWVDQKADAEKPLACPGCISSKELAIQLKVEAVKQQILSKLHLAERPNITTTIPRELVAEALKRLERQHHRHHRHQRARWPSTSTAFEFQGDQPHDEHLDDSGPDEEYYGKPSEVIAFAEPGPRVNNNTLLEFSPPHERVQNLEVTSATLWVQLRLKPEHRSDPARHHQLSVFVFVVKDSREPHLNLEMIASRKIHGGRTASRQIDVRDAVSKWYASARSVHDKLTLLVDCSGCDSMFDIVLFSDAPKSSSSEPSGNDQQVNVIRGGERARQSAFRPFLTIATRERPVGKRQKRHVVTCDANPGQCCRQSLYVSFKDLGWDDWIIAPKGYFANFCMGSCRRQYRSPDSGFAHFHSHVMEEYRNKNPFASIAPCCAPTRLASMSLIYFDPDLNIIKADLPKMVVEECGCT